MYSYIYIYIYMYVYLEGFVRIHINESGRLPETVGQNNLLHEAFEDSLFTQ